LYNLVEMVRRISLSQFRFAIREVVHKAENGEPTILTHYRRDVAAIVPMSSFDPETPSDKKKASATGTSWSRRDKVS
jgi:antitoxin (DNA-binding transcriptional repressor) of toxin-antitoxin stability system